MATIPYPLINGARPDFAKISLTFQAAGISSGPPLVPGPVIGFTSLEFHSSMDGTVSYGASQLPIGQTNGQLKCSAKATFYEPEYAALITALSNANGGLGYMTQRFNILCQYSLGPTLPMIEQFLYGCRIMGESESHKKGGAELEVMVDIQPIVIAKNGVFPTDDNLTTMAALALSLALQV
jgi:hypothetical protein